jgi:hypothetical protein
MTWLHKGGPRVESPKSGSPRGVHQERSPKGGVILSFPQEGSQKGGVPEEGSLMGGSTRCPRICSDVGFPKGGPNEGTLNGVPQVWFFKWRSPKGGSQRCPPWGPPKGAPKWVPSSGFSQRVCPKRGPPKLVPTRRVLYGGPQARSPNGVLPRVVAQLLFPIVSPQASSRGVPEAVPRGMSHELGPRGANGGSKGVPVGVSDREAPKFVPPERFPQRFSTKGFPPKGAL